MVERQQRSRKQAQAQASAVSQVMAQQERRWRRTPAAAAAAATAQEGFTRKTTVGLPTQSFLPFSLIKRALLSLFTVLLSLPTYLSSLTVKGTAWPSAVVAVRVAACARACPTRKLPSAAAAAAAVFAGKRSCPAT